MKEISRPDIHNECEPISPDEVRKKAEILISSINNALGYQKMRKEQNKRKASIIKMSSILLAGSATILLGLQISGYEKYLKEIAFVLGALVTLLNAVEPFFNFRALWVEHEAALAKFYRLKDRIEFYLVGKEATQVNPEIIKQYYAEYEEIWSTTSRAWISHRRGGANTTEANL